MAELATIARPYADALFKAQASDLAGTAAWLDELAAVADFVGRQVHSPHELRVGVQRRLDQAGLV